MNGKIPWSCSRLARRAVLTIIFAIAGTRASAETIPPSVSDLTAQLDALAAPYFPANQPGAAILVRKGEQVLLRKAYGMAQLELGVAMRPEMIFRLGSITKQFTAAAVMMLVDEDKVSLQDDVRKFVPEYSPPNTAVVTIEELLTHTGGVPNYTEQPTFHRRRREDLTHREVLETFKDLPLEYSPGTRWRYSNSDYYLLGMVIEKVAGMDFPTFLAERLTKPLGMSHTGYGAVERIIPGRVAGYDRNGDVFSNAALLSMSPPFAAGGLVSSIDDLALWDSAIANGKLLKKVSWERVFTPARLRDGTATHYGFGWSIGAWEGHRVVSHGGGIPGFSTAIMRFPEDEILVVVLCNALPAKTDASGLALKLAATVAGRPIADPPVVAVAPAILDRYVGVYAIDDKLRAVVRRDGARMTVQQTGGPLLALQARSESGFFVKGTPLRFEFLRDRAGRVTAFDATQPNATTEHRIRTDEPVPGRPAIISIDAKVLEKYVGAYELRPGFVATITRDGAGLYIQATGQERFEMFPTAANKFFLEAVEAQITFHPGTAGVADSLVLHQGGRDVTGKRLR